MANKNQPTQLHTNDWMVIYLTYDFHDAHVVAGRLTSEGIPNFVHRQAGAGAMGIVVGAIGEIRVLVRPKDYDLAESILFDDTEDAQLPDSTDDIIDGGAFDE